jgi:hypothetical protein
MKSTPANKPGEFWRRSELRTKVKRSVLKLETWNVRTMLQAGKMQERAKELKKIKHTYSCIARN